MPDAGAVVDYNRFAYARNNPLKFSDPSGHCALLDDGFRSAEDAECWEAVDELYNGWKGDEDYWKDLFGVNDRDTWMEIYGNNPRTNAAYFQGHLDTYWRDFYRSTGAYHEKYNLPPVMNPVPPQPELWLPGSQLVVTVGRDVYACTHSVKDCGNALDDASTALSATAMECAIAGFGPCARAAAFASSATATAGTVLAGVNVYSGNGKASGADVVVSDATTWAGSTKYAAKGNSSVGFAISSRYPEKFCPCLAGSS